MLKDIQVTLYDIFGYLLPGFIFLAGIAMLFWAIFMPSAPIQLSTISVDNWIVILVGAYIAGHMVQAIANLLTKKLQSAENTVLSKGKPDSFPNAVIDSATKKVNLMLGVKLKDMKPSFLYQVCDEAIAQFGITSDRDIYIYREGFYRGLTVSFMVLFVGLIARVLVPSTSVNISGNVLPISVSMLLFFDVISLIAARLSFNRYKRFGDYRVREAVIGFLLLWHNEFSKGSK
jgi:hypothetical protein